MCDAKHEARLIEEYCGGDELLRKAFDEYSNGLKQLADSGDTWKEVCGGKSTVHSHE